MATRFFFLTAADTLAWLAAVEEARPVVYCEAFGDGKRPRTYDRADEIPDLGRVTLLPSGLVDQRELLVHAKPYKFVPKVFRGPGGTDHAVYPALNPGSVDLHFAGVASDSHIAPGDLSYMSSDAPGQELSRLMWKVFGKLGLVRGSVGIGPEAVGLHRDGYRLCRSLAADPEVDARFADPVPGQRAIRQTRDRGPAGHRRGHRQ
jgi:hypothetical protein